MLEKPPLLAPLLQGLWQIRIFGRLLDFSSTLFKRLTLENLSPYGTCRVFGPAAGFRPECAGHKNEGKVKKYVKIFSHFLNCYFFLSGRS